jgi:hypothetical protein
MISTLIQSMRLGLRHHAGRRIGGILLVMAAIIGFNASPALASTGVIASGNRCIWNSHYQMDGRNHIDITVGRRAKNFYDAYSASCPGADSVASVKVEWVSLTGIYPVTMGNIGGVIGIPNSVPISKADTSFKVNLWELQYKRKSARCFGWVWTVVATVSMHVHSA